MLNSSEAEGNGVCRHSEQSVLLFPCLSWILKTGTELCFLRQTCIFFLAAKGQQLGVENTSRSSKTHCDTSPVPLALLTLEAAPEASGMGLPTSWTLYKTQQFVRIQQHFPQTGKSLEQGALAARGRGAAACTAQHSPSPAPATASPEHRPRAEGKNAPGAPSHAAAAVEFLEVAAEETLKFISLQNRRFTYS